MSMDRSAELRVEWDYPLVIPFVRPGVHPALGELPDVPYRGGHRDLDEPDTAPRPPLQIAREQVDVVKGVVRKQLDTILDTYGPYLKRLEEPLERQGDDDSVLLVPGL